MYNDIKTNLADLLGLTKDALHIHVGLAIFFAAVLLFRARPSSLMPWLCVVAFELANELMDIFHWSNGAIGFELGDAGKDALNTMLWPTIIMIWFRLRDARKARAAAAPPASDAAPR